MRNGMSASEAGKLGAEKSKAIIEKIVQDRIDKYLLSPKLCKNCRCGLPYDKKLNSFCSSSCAATLNNKEHPKRKREHTYFCLFCSKELKDGNKKFCNNKHQNDYGWNEIKRTIENNGIFPSSSVNGETSRRIVKKYLLEKHGHKCSICSLSEWMGKEIPLIVDHIDGNSVNSKVENFRLVCGNCDMQLPTYKSKNKNSGRAYRRERYAQGKSY